jgi:hypothetical protein
MTNYVLDFAPLIKSKIKINLGYDELQETDFEII